jgi:hypothetical protein
MTWRWRNMAIKMAAKKYGVAARLFGMKYGWRSAAW